MIRACLSPFLLVIICAHPASALKVERLTSAGPAGVSAPGGTARRGREVASGLAFVRFEEHVSSKAASTGLSAAGFTLKDTGFPGGWMLVGLPDGMPVSAALPILRGVPGAAAAEPSSAYRAKRHSNDPDIVFQYAIRLVDTFRAWDYDTGASTRVTVAVIDSGIDSAHPELTSKFAGTSQFFDPNAGGAKSANDPPTPACNHATRVSGVAAAASDNGIGIAGVSWGAKLLSLKVFDDADCNQDCSSAACATQDAAIAKAVNYATGLHNSAANGKMVINMSIGQSYSGCSALLQTALTAATTSGVMVVAAAGNNGAAGVDSPANCQGVVPVGATDSSDAVASFSAIGGDMAGGGVTAPGVGIYTTDLNGGYAYADGTSFSSPFVAGLAALMWSANPYLTNTQLADYLRASAADKGKSGPDTSYGYGRVDAFKAVLYAVNGSAAGYTGRPELEKAYAYPSPCSFASGRPLSFSIPEDVLGPGLEITVYTQEGEKIKKLTAPSWDGKNEAGQKVASGVYIFFVKTDNGTARGKFAVLR